MQLKAIWQNNTPYSKFLLSVGIILICAVLFTIVSTMVASAVYGVSMLQLQGMMNDFENPLTISILKVIQTFSTIGTFIIPAFVIAYFFDVKPSAYLGLDKKPLPSSSIFIFILLIISMPLINFLGEVNSHMSLPSFMSGLEKWMKDSEDKAAILTEKFLAMNSLSDFLFSIFMIALLPAIGEELMFRGIVQRIFGEWLGNKHVAVWLSAILFSAMHMQFYGFIPRMLLGAMFGYLYVWSGTLWLPMLGHFINNAAAVIFTYLFNQKIISFDADKIGTGNDYVSILISALLTAYLLWMIHKKEKNKEPLLV